MDYHSAFLKASESWQPVLTRSPAIIATGVCPRERWTRCDKCGCHPNDVRGQTELSNAVLAAL